MRCPAPGSGECPAQNECRSKRRRRRLLWLEAEAATLVSIRCADLRPTARPQCRPVTPVKSVKDVPHPSHGGSAPLALKIMCFRTYVTNHSKMPVGRRSRRRIGAGPGGYQPPRATAGSPYFRA
jgi:hypothetical protein